MTLLSLLSDLVAEDPEAPIAIDAHPTQWRLVSRRRLHERALALAGELAGAGLGAGGCAAVWLPNWSDALCWQAAAASLGAHVVGVNTRYNVDEATHILDRARPGVVAIAHGFHGLDLTDRLRRAVAASAAPPPSVAVVAGPHTETPPDPAPHDVGGGAWVPRPPGAGAPASPPAPGRGEELAAAFTTSGTSGRPKLAAHREAAVVAHARADATAMGLRPGDPVVCALPLSGVFGFSTAMAAIAGRGVCLLEPVFEEDQVLADMARHNATHLVGGDDLVARLADAWGRRHCELPAWRWLGIADFAGRAEELAAWAEKEFGAVATGVYGSSEVFALAAMWPPGTPAPHRWRAGGRLVSPGMEARVVDPVSRQVLGPADRGELELAGPSVVDAYLGDPEALAAAVSPEGWFATGDLAEVDQEGAITFYCRMGDVLRLRGFLVDPAEIEHRLAAHEAVRSTKVVGIRGADGGQAAVAFVVPRPGTSPDPDELRAWCADTLAGFKVPAAVHLIEDMPTTVGTNGTKIRAGVLREWAQDLATP